MHLNPYTNSQPADACDTDEHDAQARRMQEEGLALLEHAYSPSGAPVLGLFVYVAETTLMRSLKRRSTYQAIAPSLIGTPAILSARPGISQTELAGYLGIERATAGKQVAACIERGWIRREVCGRDKRRFSLFISPSGERMLEKITSIIPQHESEFASNLTAAERETLKNLLRRLIIGG